MKKILIVEDDVAFGTMIQVFFGKKGYNSVLVHSGKEAFDKIKETFFDIILTDVRLPDAEGQDILKKVKTDQLPSQVILMTSYGELKMAVEAMKEGAFDFVSKPFRPEAIIQTIENALKHTQVKDTSKKQPSPREKTSSIIKGISEASIKLNNYIELVAPTNMSVLIMGESGTGKEEVAKNIHQLSKRKAAPFVAVDCGAIPKEIASSEFFGHLKGSFTGAINDKTGHFQAANTGTLFLDEIGNLSYELQVQLLRALQERKIKPVGGNTEIDVDIRVIAATNEDLKQAVTKGDFREDLYHRLNEFSIKVPSLKERKEDLMLFANHFLNQANLELEKNVIGFTEEALNAFEAYNWPGNLRELKNMVKRSVLLCQGDFISLEVLPHEIAESSGQEDFSLFNSENEEKLIIQALKKSSGNKSQAARLLSIDRKTLYNKLKEYGIKF